MQYTAYVVISSKCVSRLSFVDALSTYRFRIQTLLINFSSINAAVNYASQFQVRLLASLHSSGLRRLIAALHTCVKYSSPHLSSPCSRFCMQTRWFITFHSVKMFKKNLHAIVIACQYSLSDLEINTLNSFALVWKLFHVKKCIRNFILHLDFKIARLALHLIC